MGRSARATGARVAAMICFVGSSFAMFFSRQKNEKYKVVAISSDWTGLMFCAIVNIAVCIYNCFVLFISSNSQLWKTIIFVDMVICGLVCSSLGVGWQTYAFLDEGNRNAVYANWRPVSQAFLILAIQILELSIVLLLLKCPGKPQYDLTDFFHANKSSKQRSWLLASGLGIGVLLSLVLITSYVADRVMDPKDVNNPFLKEIISSGPSSITACILVYCIVTPLLEEVVYRGFLVTSLASRMNWQLAVTISSIVFSAAHFSGENFLQLLIVGFVLGCSYCWTGNLSASISIHSLYNALILYSTYIS